jgi:hypothetical protein
MNWANFDVTNGQHAPAPGCAHAVPSRPSQVAFTTAHDRTPLATFQVIHKPISVRIVLLVDENRFARIQAIGPVVEAGGRIESSATAMTSPYRSTSAMRVLNQFMNAEVSRLSVRNTAMVSRITSTAWPVWFNTVPVNTLTKSG